MTTQGERLAKVEAWIEGHEQQCKERLGDIKADIEVVHGRVGQMKTEVAGMKKAAWAVAMALIIFLLKDAYSGLKHPPPTAVTTVVTAPPAR